MKKMYDVERITEIISDIKKYFRDLVFYRNLLSHEYYDLTEEDIFEVFKRIEIVKKFVGRIKDILREGSL